jgi:hypothetical protein
MVVVDFHRIPGESTEWVLQHARVGMEDVRAEIEASGFPHTRTIEILKENFIPEFELPGG